MPEFDDFELGSKHNICYANHFALVSIAVKKIIPRNYFHGKTSLDFNAPTHPLNTHSASQSHKELYAPTGNRNFAAPPKHSLSQSATFLILSSKVISYYNN